MEFLYSLRALKCILCLFLVASCACNRSIMLIESSDSGVAPIVVGDRRSVEEGKAHGITLSRVDPSIYQIALGLASDRKDPNRQGTALLINNRAFISPVGLEGRSVPEAADGAVFSSFMVGLRPNSHPAARYRVNAGDRGISISSIYKKALTNGDRLFIWGRGRFSVITGASLLTAPNKSKSIYGENSSQFYRILSPQIDVEAYFAGIVLKNRKQITGANRRVFFPKSSGRLFSENVGLFHFAILPDNAEPNDATRALELGRLVTTSRMTSGDVYVYRIDNWDKR